MAEATVRSARGGAPAWAWYPAPVLLVPLTWLCYVHYDVGPGVAFDLRPLLFPMAIWFGASFGRMGLVCYLVGAFPFGFLSYSIDAYSVGGMVDEYLACIALILVFSRDGAIDERVTAVFSRLQEAILHFPIRSFLILGFIISLWIGGFGVELRLDNLLMLLMILLGCRGSAADDAGRLIKAIFAASVPVAILWCLRWFYLNAAFQGDGVSVSIDHVLSLWPSDFASFVMALMIGRLIGNVFRSEQSRLDESTGTIVILAVLALLFTTLRPRIGLTSGLTSTLSMEMRMPILYAFAFLLGCRYGMRGLVGVAIATVVMFLCTALFLAQLVTPDGVAKTTFVIYDQTLDNGIEYFANIYVRDPGFVGAIAVPLFALIGAITIRRYRIKPEPANSYGARFRSQ